MEARTRARAIGFGLAVIIFGAVGWMIYYQMRGVDRTKVVVVDPISSEGGQAAAIIPKPVLGFVVAADGMPVAGAEVLLATEGNYIDVYNASRRPGPAVWSDKDGRFSFLVAQAWSDLVVRCNQGFVHVRSGEMPADARIVLRAWGRVEGVLKVAGKVQADQSIMLSGQIAPRVMATADPNKPIRYLNGNSRLQLSQSIQTDENGRFVFARVVPGQVILSRQGPAVPQSVQFSRAFTVANVDVSPSQTIQVEIGGTGRPIVGRLVLDESDEQLPLSGSIALKTDTEVRAGLHIPSNWASLGDAERAKIIDAWALHSAYTTLTAPIVVSPDGAFRAEDIPTGQHAIRIASESLDPVERRIEILAEGSLVFVMPSIPGGRSDEPFDVGAVNVHIRPRVKIGALAPQFEAVKADKSTVKLSDYRGKYVLLSFAFDYQMTQQPDSGQLVRVSSALQDRFGSDDRLAMLAIVLPQREGAGEYSVPSIAGWTVATIQDWRKRLDSSYTSSPATYLIDPEGKVLAKISPSSNASYSLLERAMGPMRGQAAKVAVVVEKLTEASATAAFEFKTIPTLSKDDAGQNATFSLVDGRKADFGGSLRIFNDGLAPRHDHDEPLMLTFAPGTMEGRIKADLGKPVEIEQINTYSWFRDSNRWAQVYRVYASDGSAATFDAQPKNGTDPAACGWSLIASVDTRDGPDGTDLRDKIKGQSGVSIRGEAGSIGSYRYLLFVTFATETYNVWGQTFWSEIDVVGR
jgi:hypothetical protein